jgi:lycopene beta-cyclase
MLKYDYIILGTGAAGLSLLMRMIRSANFNDKKILLIDKEPKNRNDRTWCFWENKPGFFEDIVYNRWDRLSFFSNAFSGDLDMPPYQYKMIRGIDFYAYCFDKIARHSNIDIVYGEVRSVLSEEDHITIHLDNQELNCAPAKIFNSIYRPSDISNGNLQLLQHFKGWMIDSDNALFDPRHATLMDFRIHQQYGTSFMYVLPTSANRALVEYTLFTPKTLETEQYDTELRDYVHSVLKIKNFTITEEEFGIIPMTNAKFKFFQNGMYNIGIAGGQTKASTGYTFQFIQKQSELIMDCLNRNKPLSGIPDTSRRFHFYDSVLLQLLVSKKLSGEQIFSRMFQRNRASLIFKFLDNETSLAEEVRLISTLQTVPFLKAAMRVLN